MLIPCLFLLSLKSLGVRVPWCWYMQVHVTLLGNIAVVHIMPCTLLWWFMVNLDRCLFRFERLGTLIMSHSVMLLWLRIHVPTRLFPFSCAYVETIIDPSYEARIAVSLVPGSCWRERESFVSIACSYMYMYVQFCYTLGHSNSNRLMFMSVWITCT